VLEVERQFLVKVPLLPELGRPREIVQVYLSLEPEVRVRLIADAAFLTIKSSGDLAREEYEYSIPAEDARSIVRLAPYPPIEKRRFRLPVGDLVWEIDQYEGENAGLWSAEVELEDGGQDIDAPAWLGTEVTYDARFKNKNLARRPLSQWPDRETVLAGLA
jgi:adenylate cyclase